VRARTVELILFIVIALRCFLHTFEHCTTHLVNIRITGAQGTRSTRQRMRRGSTHRREAHLGGTCVRMSVAPPRHRGGTTRHVCLFASANGVSATQSRKAVPYFDTLFCPSRGATMTLHEGQLAFRQLRAAKQYRISILCSDLLKEVLMAFRGS
jgi:hypothetical protein